MATVIVEGVDNEVLLAFIVLITVGVLTAFYYLNTNGQTSYNLINGWHYLRNLFEGEFEDTRNEETGSQEFRSENTNDDNIILGDGAIEDREPERTLQSETSDNNQLNSDFADMSRGQTEGSYGAREEPRCRTGFEASEETSNGTTDSATEQLSLRIKHHEVERNYVVGLDTTVGELKRLSFPNEVAQGRRVRLIYSGRLLHDESARLSFYGITNFSVVHAQISDMPQAGPSQQGQMDDEMELDMSRLFIPLLTFILCGCWYGLISYRQLFNTTSTAILIIVTAAYAFMVYVMLG